MTGIRRSLPRTCIAAGVIAVSLITVHAQSPREGGGVSHRDSTGAQTQGSRISREQRERLDARIAAATAIIHRLESDAQAQKLGSGWRQAALHTVLPLSLEGLQQVEQEVYRLDALAGAAQAHKATTVAARAADTPGALGNSDRDLVYTPVSPCRYIDTRNAGGKIDGVRSFDFDLNGAAHGGHAACSFTQFNALPDDIGALAMNVTLVDTSTAATPGFVAVKPTESAPTTSLLNWYEQGPGVQVANQGVVSLFQDLGTDVEFVIQTSGAVHIVVDIFGAFVAPHATALQTVHLLNFVVVQDQQSGFVESPPCTVGYTLTGGGCYTEGSGHWLSFSYPGTDDNRWACRSYNGSFPEVAHFLFARAICSRTPGR